MKDPNENKNSSNFDWNKDTPFYEQREYNGSTGKGKETYFEDVYTEEEKTEWVKNN